MKKFTKHLAISNLSQFNPLNLPRMVVNPFRNRVQNIVEAILLSGTGGRLLIAGAVIGLVALVFGLAGYLVAMGTEQSFSNPWDAVWWAFLRLTDPGYLGDDEGILLRFVSTFVTVTGYVLFLGVLVAILTQGLNEAIRKLEMGLTPIRAKHHIILLGWMSRTPWIVRDFVASEGRVLRFLDRIGARRLKLVMLVEAVDPRMADELRTFLGTRSRRNRILFRSGSPLRLDHLQRVDYLRASSIVLPAVDATSQEARIRSDNASIKTILSISHSLRFSQGGRPLPLLVAELYDARKIRAACATYQGPIEVIAGDEVLSRMATQIARNPQISIVYQELISQGIGNEIFVKDSNPSLAGSAFWKAAEAAGESILLGVARQTPAGVEPILNPPADFMIEAGDKLVYLAETWAQAEVGPIPAATVWPTPVGEKRLSRLPRPDQRILILGWSRWLPALLHEFESYENQVFEVTVAGSTDIAARERHIAHYGRPIGKTRLRQIELDYTLPDSMGSLRPEEYDTIFCLSTDATGAGVEADASNLVAYSVLRSLLAERGKNPHVVVELLDELNVGLVDAANSEFLLSPHVLSHLLTQVALRRELNAIYQALFNSSETEIIFRSLERYGFEPGVTVSFDTLRTTAREHGEIALGCFLSAREGRADCGVRLNPKGDFSWELELDDRLVVLRT